MTTLEYLESKKHDESFMSCVAEWRKFPAKDGVYAEYPDYLDSRVPAALLRRGVAKPYTHQRKAWDAIHSGDNVVVVTPTASGKTMCYNIPVLNQILINDSSRALYLFPTKALGADQVASLYGLIETIGAPIKTFTYDGDTPGSARKAIREAGHIVVTNPDMLHANMLPSHTKWVKLFENLKYVVIDELHMYRGVFGSNMANVVRRLKRLCAFYGANPIFICCSATIANPTQLAETVVGGKFTLIDENGAPQGEKHVILYNPPVVNSYLGIRMSAVNETRRIATDLVKGDIPTIVFAKARLQVEVITHELKKHVADTLGNTGKVRGYRGGYLPSERRDIEAGLRDGTVRAVVSTNALELGVDIGSLDACVLCGYPGTISSMWQQSGRSGRRQSAAITILVASSSPLDQYLMNHPEYLFGQSPEHALAEPNNFHIYVNHFKCAAYELPFDAYDKSFGADDTAIMLPRLKEAGFLRESGGRYYWMNEEFPASEVHLRSAGDENFLIIDTTKPKDHRVIGEMDRFAVPMLLHDFAIYLHEAKQYQVEKLDFPNKKAYVKAVDVDYYTDADVATTLRVLMVDETEPLKRLSAAREAEGAAEMDDANITTKSRGEVLVASMATIFKKMKLDTHETLGFGNIDLPESQMHTISCWISLSDAVAEAMPRDTLETGMIGLAHLLRGIAPLYLMCASQDISVHYHVRDPFTQKPTIFMYDSIPGGVGLSEKIYTLVETLIKHSRELVMSCACERGCPSCVGPASNKTDTLAAIDAFLMGRVP